MNRLFAAVLGIVAVTQFADATSTIHFLSLSELVCKADVVAVVQITGADTRFGERWAYRAHISKAIRGESDGATIYFAPPSEENYGDQFTYRLGRFYLVVLHESEASVIDPKGHLSPLSEGERGQHYEIGWGPTIVMPIENRCDFDECTNEVAVSYVIDLPDGVVSHESQEDCGHDLAGATWVAKEQFVSLLTKVNRDCP